MKNICSLIACGIICIVLVQYRIANSDIRQGHAPLKITEWDAFGYYMYLPAIAIYHDCTELNWLTEIDKTYAVTGGNGWQALKTDNGKYVFKYLGGVAILQAPFFLSAHAIAKQLGYPPDGFSPPYQYALGFGIIFYCLLALLVLRQILLRFFNDTVTTVTLIMVCLATNFIQYTAVDSGQSHGYLFVLYVLVLYTTIRWHEMPRILWAALTGYIVGLATMSRPTEAIMFLIPLLWCTQSRETAATKWQAVRQNRHHIPVALTAGLAGILPQLLYWKYTTGSFMFDVGSKWDFAKPHLRVLTGWEKGWFIYTPVTIFFILGMFFIKKFPFRKPVLWFCLLNIYIIIAWHEWRYGGSYSTRALVQSYPVFALPFAAFAGKVLETKWRLPFYTLCVYLLCVNLFQVVQYCSTTLHYDDMNRKYYGRIYLNNNPSPTDMSLLDHDEVINDEKKYRKKILIHTDTALQVSFPANESSTLIDLPIADSKSREQWIKIESSIKARGHLWQSFLHADLKEGDSVKHAKVRLFSPISESDKVNRYTFYLSIPGHFTHSQLKVYLSSPSQFHGVAEGITITRLDRQ